MAFGLQKLAVLESKLDIYEDLSKEMLDKLERAVGTISENSNKIAIILERHENRLDEGGVKGSLYNIDCFVCVYPVLSKDLGLFLVKHDRDVS